MPHDPSIERIFDAIVDAYPEGLRWLLANNRSRLLWQVETVRRHVPEGGTILDIGAGVVPFMLICQRLGYRTTVLDDLEDAILQDDDARRAFELFQQAGVRVITGDALKSAGGAMPEGELDLVTSQDSMDHWHHSPKAMFHALWQRTRPGGLFWIGTPNCVNLRKRITVPLGIGKWSRMEDWYEKEVFRGKVREPDTDDLRYIARDLGASRVKVTGRNWLGYRHPSPLVRAVTPAIDRMMRPFPSICTTIYLFAWK